MSWLKSKLPALGGLATTLGGIIMSPLVLGIIPPYYAAAIVAVGAAIQAVTKAIHAPVNK